MTEQAALTTVTSPQATPVLNDAPFSKQPLAELMGVQITGINLSQPIDDATRDAILDVLVEHHVVCFRNQSLSKQQQYAFTERFGELEGHVTRGWSGNKSPVVHPIVRTHPETGRKLLYIGHHTSHIVELPRGEGRALLYQLLDFATQPHRVYTHHWQAGDLVMWDNRCLVHRGMRDFDMNKHRRVLHRTVLKGTKPY